MNCGITVTLKAARHCYYSKNVATLKPNDTQKILVLKRSTRLFEDVMVAKRRNTAGVEGAGALKTVKYCTQDPVLQLVCLTPLLQKAENGVSRKSMYPEGGCNVK